MQTRALLRWGTVLFAAIIGLLVYWQWEPGAERAVSGRTTPEFLMPETEGDREVASLTEALDVVQTLNGDPVFQIRAGRHVSFADGWNEWEDVELVIYGRNSSGERADVDVRGDRMRTSGQVSEFNEVRILGDVAVDLPGGGSFNTRRLDYDAITGIVSNCTRNTLLYAGLEIKADCLNFQSGGEVRAGRPLVAEDLRMWGNLAIRDPEQDADASAGATTGGLRGGGEELRFRPGESEVFLDGGPSLDAGGAAIRAEMITLRVSNSATELRGVDATGNVRVRYDAERAGDAEAEPEAADDAAARVLRGDRVELEFGEDGALASMHAFSDGSAARLTLPGYGRLDAGEIQVATAGAEQQIEATGKVTWLAEDGGSGVSSLSSRQLALSVGSRGVRQIQARGQTAVEMAPGSGLAGLSARDLTVTFRGGSLEGLGATGDVIADLEAGPDGASRRLSGPSMALQWSGSRISQGDWPAGVEVRAGGRTLTAGTAKFEPATSAWVLGGTPKPSARDDDLQLEAAEIRVDPAGALMASGGVRGLLGAGHLLAAAALFGDVPSATVQATSLEATSSGQLILKQNVQVIWEEQSLTAGELRLEPSPARLRASGNVELVANTARDAEVPSLVTLQAANLLVEGDSGEIRLAGAANLRQGRRRITADKLTVKLGESDRWETVVAEDAVQFTDERATATGVSVEYAFTSGALTIRGNDANPAKVVLEDLEYMSREALRVVWTDEDVIIESTEAGRTRTSVVNRQGTDS